MADSKKVLLAPQGASIEIVKWKVREGSQIDLGTLLMTYKLAGLTEVKKLKAEQVGRVAALLKKEGEVVPPREPLLEVESCHHAIVMKGMCAECGLDLRALGTDDANGGKPTASVAMVHSIPELVVSEKHALEIGRKDEIRLLSNRKLVLLVDLDQTLIHTTMECVPANLKDVYHYQMSNGPTGGTVWYHTRLRPGVQAFLAEVSKMYELHVVTFGIRLYAHHITSLLDPAGQYFSHRILSRDECFDHRTKTANLKALFPCGDRMVCIIDDRDDVWNSIPNLVQVQPYKFFKGTGDINAPPGASSAAPDLLQATCSSKSAAAACSILPSASSESSASAGSADGYRTETPADRSLDLNACGSDGEKNCDGDVGNTVEPSDCIGSSSSTGISREKDPEKDVKDAGKLRDCVGLSILAPHTGCSDAPELRKAAYSAVDGSAPTCETSVVCTLDDAVAVAAATAAATAAAAATPSAAAATAAAAAATAAAAPTAAAAVAAQDLSHMTTEPVDTLLPATDSDATPSASSKTIDGDVRACDAPAGDVQAIDIPAGTSAPAQASVCHPLSVSQPNGSDWDDDDDYLVCLLGILRRVHQSFYSMIPSTDSSVTSAIPTDAPDLRVIIPEQKKKTLEGCSVTFSGVFPVNLPLQKSLAYKMATGLGASVGSVVDKDTTHLVAARLGTEKVKQAFSVNRDGLGNVAVVHPDWLWSCWYRWLQADKQRYRLTKENEIPEPPRPCAAAGVPAAAAPTAAAAATATVSIEVATVAASLKRPADYEHEQPGTSTKKLKPAEPSDGGDATDAEKREPAAAAAAISQGSDEERASEPPVSAAEARLLGTTPLLARSFSESYSPLMALDRDQIQSMDEEVEDMFDEESSDSASSTSSSSSSAKRSAAASPRRRRRTKDRLREKVLSSGGSSGGGSPNGGESSSSSDESLSADYPHGWRPQRPLREHRDAAELEEADLEGEEENRALEVDTSDDDQAGGPANGEDEDDLIAAAVEREMFS